MGDDEPMGGVRERVREDMRAERVKLREKMYNKQRKLDAKQSRSKVNQELKEEDVVQAAHCLSAHLADKEKAFTDLKNAFIQDPTHMVTFMKVEGALNALVGHLMGKDSFYELLAVECCCNLSLGDSKTCYKLAKAAIPYLLTMLQGLNYNPMKVALLTINNLCGSGDKTCQLLHSQGVLRSLERTIKIPELRENTAKALIMFTKNGSSYMSEGEVRSMANFILPYFETSERVQWLVYMMSSVPSIVPVLIGNGIHARVLELLSSLRRLRSDNIISVTSLVRLLGNLSSDEDGTTASLMLDRWEATLDITKFFLSSKYRHLCKEIYWCLGNMIQHRSPRVQARLKEKATSDFPWMQNRFSLPAPQ